MKIINWLAAVLTIIGALNWGLIGFFDMNLVTQICGSGSPLVKIIYCVVGVSGLWAIFAGISCCKK